MDFDTFIGGSIGFNDFPRGIGGSIVNDDEFKIGVSLIENTFNGLRQIGSGIEDWHVN